MPALYAAVRAGEHEGDETEDDEEYDDEELREDLLTLRINKLHFDGNVKGSWLELGVTSNRARRLMKRLFSDFEDDKDAKGLERSIASAFIIFCPSCSSKLWQYLTFFEYMMADKGQGDQLHRSRNTLLNLKERLSRLFQFMCGIARSSFHSCVSACAIYKRNKITG